MTLYLAIDLIVVAVPLALSFDRRVAYFRAWPAVFTSTAVIALPYVVWDALAASAEVWRFSAQHGGRPLLFGLPAGELLFFVVVPFSCLFLYEVVRAYLPHRQINFPRAAGFAIAGLSFTAAVLVLPRGYTSVVFGAFGLFFVLASAANPSLLRQRTAWFALALSYLPFALVNGVLTSLPVVRYNPRDILGLRVLSIPVEDFFYSFSMLGLLFLVYDRLRRRLRLGGVTQ